ncbi:(2E,6E)-farnesyl diphosphate synthase [Pantoea sp. Mhis]|uniref:(2E,6E)-farnesyl diphosphate synthase n=1 Tax=Pantoea sp. Mhis TaxID=2576759 RepID=UPI00135A041C|nr:(2E,6E)-farnesyl diphosphate synthase [Pantoea sp. Mhis]MXP56239.1 (2E,6E)-farnesyl diphosphate synthase [Pantoea sp. Mhis]
MDFKKLINQYYERVNSTLTALMDPLPQDSPLVKAMQYGTLLGGKRLRPLLVYATGEMFKVNMSSLDAPAAALECIHAYSLIHDDLPAMDNDILRRGHLTCHMKYGEDIAILAGDALQTLAFSILTDYPMDNVNVKTRLAMISELAQASGVTGMCIGQALDLKTKYQCTTVSQLEYIYHYKTGALIRTAVRLGALAAGNQSNDVLLALDNYANAIGLAFQVQDDIIDVVENIKYSDKKDMHELSSNNYLTLIGLNNAHDRVYELYQEALSSLRFLSDKSCNTNVLKLLASFIINDNK